MINVSGITKRYGNRLAVDNMSFQIAEGKVTGFVGPNGAGKSTTMRMMAGLTRPDNGRVEFAGVNYTDLPHPSHVVGSVLDARVMHPGRTARNHLRAMAAVAAIPKVRVEEVLHTVGLGTAANQRAGEFSLEMNQRLALAGALLGDPEVLLLDEPANGLDPDGIRWLRSYLGDFAARGGTVFVSSHLIGELSMFVDDLVVIGNGKLLAAKTLDEIIAPNAVEVIVETQRSADLIKLLSANNIATEIVGDRLIVRDVTRADVSQIAFDNRIQLTELSETSKSLEDTLLDMTGASAEFAAA